MKYLDDLYQQCHEEYALTKIQSKSEGADKTAVATGWEMATLTL